MKSKKKGSGEMSKRIIATSLVLVMFAVLLTGCFQKDSSVVAVVDGVEITRGEFRRFIELNLTLYTGEKESDLLDHELEELLEFMVNEQVFYAEALKRGVEISDEDFEKDYVEFKGFLIEGYFNGNNASYNRRINELNITDEELKEISKRNLIITKFIEQLQDEVKITSEMVQEFYDENLEELFTHDEMRKIRHILVSTEVEAKAIQKRLGEGEDFAELAKEFSKDSASAQNGGVMDFTEKKYFVESFGNAAFSIEIGKLSDIIQTTHGFHILEVMEVKPAGVTVLDGELAERIFAYLESEEKRNVVINLLEDLKKDVEIKL